MSQFDFIQTPITGLKLIQRKMIEDRRGFFSRFYCNEEFIEAGITKPIAQINHTLTCKKGSVRGLHFQNPPYAETKIISCLSGEVWDVAVDLRCDSPTFMQWHGEIISADNHMSIIIPEGFAHGFQALTENCELIYIHTTAYNSESEGALNVADPKLNITWPLPIGDLSERDRRHSFIGKNFQGIIL